MKRFTQIVCVVLVTILLMSTTASALEPADSRASNYFGASSVYFSQVSGNQYQVWFEVTAVGTMTELGVSEIVVERSTDEVDWDPVRTYHKESYSQMLDKNSAFHSGGVPFTATDGYSYRAIVTLYAKNSSGTGEMTEVTPVLDLR